MFDMLDAIQNTGLDHDAKNLNLSWETLPEEFRGHYVEESLAKEPYSLTKNSVMTSVYLAILVVGLTGNVMTLIVINWEKGSKSPANLFLISLSVADIITLLIGNFKLSGKI